MNRIPIFVAVLVTVLPFLGCRPQDDDSAASHAAYIIETGQAKSDLLILQTLESGDVDKTKQMLRLVLYISASVLPYYEKVAPVTNREKQEAREFAKQFLSYLVTHKDQIDPSLTATITGFRSIHQLLDGEPEQEKLRSLAKELGIELTLKSSME